MKIDPQLIIDVCSSSVTMIEAHRKLGKLKFCTFAKYARQLDCYRPNQGGKGTEKKFSRTHVSEYVCENGKFITSHKLKLKLIRDGLKEHKCEICGITEWNNVPCPIELDHIDGNHQNNLLSNLRIVCPNCHAQTDTNSGKKNKKPL